MAWSAKGSTFSAQQAGHRWKYDGAGGRSTNRPNHGVMSAIIRRGSDFPHRMQVESGMEYGGRGWARVRVAGRWGAARPGPFSRADAST